jgi:hypothetical protein
MNSMADLCRGNMSKMHSTGKFPWGIKNIIAEICEPPTKVVTQ